MSDLDQATMECDAIMTILQKYQPGGSPPPGGPVHMAMWIMESMQTELDTVKKLLCRTERSEFRETEILKNKVDTLNEMLDFGKSQTSVARMQRDEARVERDRLKAAIKEHHKQKADDRCIEDDDRLYAAAELPPCDRQVGSKEEMLKNCERFIDKRCESGKWISYAELEKERDKIKSQLEHMEEYGHLTYCPTCGSCGEAPCCGPEKCKFVGCLYGESNLKAYKEMETEVDDARSDLHEMKCQNFDMKEVLLHLAERVGSQWYHPDGLVPGHPYVIREIIANVLSPNKYLDHVESRYFVDKEVAALPPREELYKRAMQRSQEIKEGKDVNP